MVNWLKKSWKIIIYCLILSSIFTTICSRSSFLYPMNNWDDANSFMTVAKGILSGRVMYRDIYDQKGVYFYTIFMLAHFISNNSFFGVYILEIVANSITFFLMYKIMRLYIGKKMSLIFLPVIGGTVLSAVSFYWGSSAEEFFNPLLISSLYISIKYFKEEYPKPMDNKKIMLVGAFAGIIALIKYNILGFFFAWMMMVAISRLVQKDFKNFLKQCGLFLVAMFIPFIPWIVYFAANHALYDWYEGYVLYNVTGYSNFESSDLTIGTRIYQLAKILYWIIRQNIQYFIFVLLGGIWFIVDFSKKWIEKINLIAIAGLLFVGIYIGGAELKYYSLPFCIFVPLGFATIGRLLEKIYNSGRLQTIRESVDKRVSCITALFVLIAITASGFFVYHTSMNTYFMKYEKEDLFLYQFKDIIGAEGQNTLLNISCLDAGLYTVCDIAPTCRWFQTQYIAKDEVSEEQERYVKEGLTDYVIAREFYPDCIWDQYELVGESTLNTPESNWTYYLFKNINLQ